MLLKIKSNTEILPFACSMWIINPYVYVISSYNILDVVVGKTMCEFVKIFILLLTS